MSLDSLDRQAQVAHFGEPTWEIVSTARRSPAAMFLEGRQELLPDQAAIDELVDGVSTSIDGLGRVRFANDTTMEQWDVVEGLRQGKVNDVSAALVGSMCLHNLVPHWVTYGAGRWWILTQQLKAKRSGRRDVDAVLQDLHHPDGEPPLTLRLSQVLPRGVSVPDFMGKLHRDGRAATAVDATLLARNSGLSEDAFPAAHLRPRFYHRTVHETHRPSEDLSPTVMMTAYGPRGRNILLTHSNFIRDVAIGNPQRAAYDLMVLDQQGPEDGVYPEIDGRAPNRHIEALVRGLCAEGAAHIANRAIVRYLHTRRQPSGTQFPFLIGRLSHATARAADDSRTEHGMKAIARRAYQTVIERSDPGDPSQDDLRRDCRNAIASLAFTSALAFDADLISAA